MAMLSRDDRQGSYSPSAVACLSLERYLRAKARLYSENEQPKGRDESRRE